MSEAVTGTSVHANAAGPTVIALAQCCHPGPQDVRAAAAAAATATAAKQSSAPQPVAPWQAALALAERWMAAAAERGAQMIVFPENFMAPWSLPDDAFASTAQPLDGPFVTGMARLAQRFDLWTVFTFNESATGETPGAAETPPAKRAGGGAEPSPAERAGGEAEPAKPFNTAVVLDDRGHLAGSYRKMHLFDACDTPESSRHTPGARAFTPIETPFGKLGLGICYDLRFPELAQQQAAQGCDLLVYPASWFDGPGKVDQWNQLLAQRAKETGAVVAGVSRADRPDYIGSSRVVLPDGTVAAQAGREEELLLVRL